MTTYTLCAAELINGAHTLVSRASFYLRSDLEAAVGELRVSLQNLEEPHERQFIEAVIALFEANIAEHTEAGE